MRRFSYLLPFVGGMLVLGCRTGRRPPGATSPTAVSIHAETAVNCQVYVYDYGVRGLVAREDEHTGQLVLSTEVTGSDSGCDGEVLFLTTDGEIPIPIVASSGPGEQKKRLGKGQAVMGSSLVLRNPWKAHGRGNWTVSMPLSGSRADDPPEHSVALEDTWVVVVALYTRLPGEANAIPVEFSGDAGTAASAYQIDSKYCVSDWVTVFAFEAGDGPLVNSLDEMRRDQVEAGIEVFCSPTTQGVFALKMDDPTRRDLDLHIHFESFLPRDVLRLTAEPITGAEGEDPTLEFYTVLNIELPPRRRK